MPDSRRLRETLDLLHKQLDEAEDIDELVESRLTEIIGEIVAVLEKRDRVEGGPASFGERLAVAARHFEQSHPTLSGTIGRLADILAQMGI